MKGINKWWEEISGERFWLGVTGHDRKREVLAAPCVDGRGPPGSNHALITQVKEGDVVFHYDKARQAIVDWSTPRGRVQKRRLAWSWPPVSGDDDAAACRSLPSWVIELERSTPLESAVPVEHIARTQWDLFPALRAFEDRVGEPLYYPFAMGSPSETRLLAGHVFKLPALFVSWFPALARAAAQTGWSAAAREHVIQLPEIMPPPEPVLSAVPRRRRG